MIKADEQLLEDLVEALEPHLGVFEGYQGCRSVYAEPDPTYHPLNETLYEILKALYDWCVRWLEDSRHDVLRTRGDRRWHAMCEMEYHLRRLLDELAEEKHT